MTSTTHTPQAVLIVSGPGGVGKGTIVSTLLGNPENQGRVGVAISATTRAPRPGEQHGKHYWFVSADMFQSMIDNGEFLEWANFGANRYGTPWASVKHANVDVLILEIDCQGAKQVLDNHTKLASVPIHSLFIAPPSWEELEERLRKRQADTEEQINHRLEVGKSEMELQPMFDQVIVNDTVESSVAKIQKIIASLHPQRR